MRRRVVVLCTAVVVLLGAVGLLGCGQPAEDTTTGSLILTVYTSGTLQGDSRQAAQDGADAVKLALEQAGGMVGPFTVNVVSLDDTDPDTGHWGADQVVTNARRAIADRNIMGYIGDSGSGATALSLPLLNEAGVLQIGPTTGYVGLTRPAGRGEPDRFYPSGVRSFGRIAPADDIQADALVETMREQGVRRLAILQDGELEALGIAGLVEQRAHAAGIDVVETKAVDADDKDQSGIAQDVAGSGADAALYAGTTTKGGATVLDALHAADPDLALFAPDGLADASLAAAIEPGTARRLLLTSPALPLDDLPPQGGALRGGVRPRLRPEASARGGFQLRGHARLHGRREGRGRQGQRPRSDHQGVLHAPRARHRPRHLVGAADRRQHDQALRHLACPGRAPRVRARSASLHLTPCHPPAGRNLIVSMVGVAYHAPRINESAL